MLFSSNLFLFLFLPVAVIGYYAANKRLRNTYLLAVSLIFYAWGEPSFVLVMIGSILFNYVMALAIHSAKGKTFRKALLAAVIFGNLAVLFVYKYLDFFIANINRLGFDLPLQHIALPLGISFFTFQAMSYVIDVYRGTAAVQKRPQDIGLYVAFFPQLVAGPIVRYQTIADQIHNRQETFADFGYGIRRFIIGMAKKVILSNNMAMVADAAFAAGDAERSVVYAWMGVIAYAFQILFDFSGYSDMAIGLGKLFGFHFLENFDYPFISKSISEFWRRWHMSLGQWFRDYVYFPLGGSRVKTKFRLILNLLVVWSLTGIWHGANWNFVLWGLMYFALITFEKLTGYPDRLRSRWTKLAYMCFTHLCILFSWVLFRSPGAGAAAHYGMSMLGLLGNPFMSDAVIVAWNQYRFFFVASALCSVPVLEYLKARLPEENIFLSKVADAVSLLACLFLLLWSVSFLMIGSHNPFIYFNF